jgi:chromosome segregation ATPase
VALAPDSSQEFVVNEERVYEDSTMVTNLTPDLLVTYVQNKAISAAARQQLDRIVAQKGLIADNDRALQDAATQIRAVTQDEDRIRQNIQSLNNVSGQQQQVQNYARQLDTHEQQLATLRDKQAELQKKKTALQGDLDRMVAALTF